MASLSRIVKKTEKKRKQRRPNPIDQVRLDNIGAPPIPLMEAKHDAELAQEIIEPEYDDAGDKFAHILFISDCKLSSSIKEQLSDYSNIKRFDKKLFANRSLQSLLIEYDCQHIWINLCQQSARDWLGCYLPRNNNLYLTVVANSGNKANKWLDDVADFADIKTKVKHLNKIKSLSFPSFSDKLENLFIHSPASPFLSCMGLSNKINRAKSKK